jgi:oligopeptide/dipeptide ABC transporter ATP-binding protein
MTPVLAIEQLSVAYRTPRGDAAVLDGVSLEVRPGEIVGLVGETGCGKTTLAHAVLGTLPQHQARIVAGEIRVEGIDLLRNAAAARHARGRTVTLVPQDPYASLNPLFRVGTQMVDLMRHTAPAETRRRLGSRRRRYEEAALAMLAALHLSNGAEVMKQYPHQLSGGQRQRVMLAMALLPQPRLVIADEPTAALDASVQAQILHLLRRISAEHGVGVLFTTHNLGAAWDVCDRIVVMHAGRVVESGGRDAVFARPLHPYARQLLASMPQLVGNSGVPQTDAAPPSASTSGCLFSGRCPHQSQVCRAVRPSLDAREPEHVVACHHVFAAEASRA